MVPSDRALASYCKLAIVAKSLYLQRFGRSLQRKVSVCMHVCESSFYLFTGTGSSTISILNE